MTSGHDTGQGAADELKQKGQQAAERTQQKAQQAGEEAKSKLRQEVDQRSQQVAEQVESTAEAIRKAGEELRRQGKDQPADLLSKGAQKAEQLGQYLKESDSEQILSDIEDTARQKPQAALAAGVAVGFAFSRFLKASSAKRRQSSGSRQPAQSENSSPPLEVAAVEVGVPAPAPPPAAETVPPPAAGPATTPTARSV